MLYDVEICSLDYVSPVFINLTSDKDGNINPRDPICFSRNVLLLKWKKETFCCGNQENRKLFQFYFHREHFGMDCVAKVCSSAVTHFIQDIFWFYDKMCQR